MKKETKKTITTHSPSKLEPGDVLRVIYTQGCQAQPGQLAIVVPPEEFPQYLKTMLETVDPADLDQYFITVRWIPGLTNQSLPEDGFYSKARFEKVNVSKGN